MALTSAAVLAPIHRAFCKNSWQRKNWCHWAATVFCPSPPANQASRVDSPALLEPCDNSDNSKSNEISWLPRIYTYIYNIIHIYIYIYIILYIYIYMCACVNIRNHDQHDEQHRESKDMSNISEHLRTYFLQLSSICIRVQIRGEELCRWFW